MADLLFLGFVILALLFMDFVWSLCRAASKPVPSPMERVADYSEWANIADEAWKE